MNTSEISPLCPRCGQIDAVRKVSAIHREGISVSEYETYATGQLGDKVISWPVKKEQVWVNLLAKKLSPPPPAASQGEMDWEERLCKLPPIVYLFLVVILVGMVACMFAGTLAESFGLPTTIAWVAAILLFLVMVWVLWDLRRKFPERKRQWILRKRAIERWHSLHYCFRCDGVFIPGQNRFVPIDAMQSFLYEQDA